MPDLIANVPLNFNELRTHAAEAAVLARKLSDGFEDDAELRGTLDLLINRIQNISGPISGLPDIVPYNRISSESWNTFLEAISIDIRAIYDAITAIEAASKQMDVIAQSDLSQTKAAILKAINQLRVYQFLKDYPDFQDLKIVDFIRTVNESQKRPLAVIDNDIRTLELPVKSRRVISATKLNGRTTTVATKLYGGGKLTGFGDKFSRKNILDPNLNNYWVEVMSTNAPVKFTHQCSWGDYTANGVVAEITLDFSHVERGNNIKMMPFSEFPYNVIDVAYKESQSSTTWRTIPGFTIREAVEDWVEFDFSYIAIDQIRITIEQPNFVREVSLVPESLVRKNSLWAQLKQDELVYDIHEIELNTRQQGVIDVDPEQLRKMVADERIKQEFQDMDLIGERYSEYEDYSKYVKAVANVVDEVNPGTGNEIRELSDGSKYTVEDPTRQIISYDYLLGIRALVLSAIVYEPVAYYESGEFITNGTVVEVQLDTEEQHMDFVETDGAAHYRKTSIEYEVEVSPDSRFPLVPISALEGDNYVVRDEWIKLTRGIGRLRFYPNASSISVRKNGRRVAAENITVDGRNIHVNNYDRNAIYTATYHVDETATKVNIADQLDSTKLLSPEVFDSTDQDNKVVLKYYPYIIYEIVRDKKFWVKRDGRAIWEWNPDFLPLSVGSVRLTNGSTGVVLTKDNISDPDFDSIVFSEGNSLKIWIQETNEILEIDANPPVSPSSTTCYLKDPYDGDTIASSRFILGRTVTYDNQTFGLNIDSYEPIEVLVNGIRAVNRTDYYNREHPSFANNSEESSQYEYIQSGKVIYFNAPIAGKIEVKYSWLTQYLKLVATLRCHTPVQTINTPKLDTAKLRVKTTEL